MARVLNTRRSNQECERPRRGAIDRAHRRLIGKEGSICNYGNWGAGRSIGGEPDQSAPTASAISKEVMPS